MDAFRIRLAAGKREIGPCAVRVGRGGIDVKFDEKIASLMEKFTPKQLLMMAGAAGLLTFVVLYFGLSALMWSGDKTQPAQAPPVKKVKVVQAKTDIKARAEVKESMLQVVEIPEELLPSGAITDTKGIVGRPTRVAVMAGDVLTERKLYRSIKESGFTGMIPADRRAMSIAVTDVTGVSGFMKPGDYVDVMFVTEKMDNTRISGEVILQNVLLLGINSMADSADNQGQQGQQGKEGDGKDKDQKQASAGKPATATLAVRPEEELRLAVAAKAGQLYLALRPDKPQNMYMLDTEYSFNKGRAAQAPATPAPAPTYAPPAAQPAPSAGSSDSGGGMEIIRGTEASRGR